MLMTSLNDPVSSVICVTRREPSLMRAICTIRWTADAICARIAFSGKLTLPIMAIVSMRATASRGVLAWIVVSEPSWPVFIACNISMHSSPRTSPSTIRSGRIRSALMTNSLCRTAPLPSTFGGRHSSRTTCECFICNSAESSMVTIRSRSSIKPDITFSKVVLPAPVPPETMMFSRACTAPFRTSSIGSVSALLRSRSSANSGFEPNLRIERMGPSTASGGIMTLTREPSFKRASTIGEDSSTRLPTADTILSITCIRCRSSLKITVVFSSTPWRSTYTELQVFTRMSLTLGSCSSGSSGPRPKTSSSTSCANRSRSAAERGMFCSPISW